MNPETRFQDVAPVAGVIGITVIGCIALWLGGAQGQTVAAAAVGGISGWLARGSGKTANVTADTATIQPDAAK